VGNPRDAGDVAGTAIYDTEEPTLRSRAIVLAVAARSPQEVVNVRNEWLLRVP